jgi:hypothetical protein
MIRIAKLALRDFNGVAFSTSYFPRENHVSSSKALGGLCVGFLGIFATGLASAQAVKEYGSLASWSTAVKNVSTYTFSGGVDGGTPCPCGGGNSLVLGPGTVTADSGNAYLYDDGLYGKGVQYFSDDPAANSDRATAAVTVSFLASAGVSALAFTLGDASTLSNTVDISVNGTALAPVDLSAGLFKMASFGLTDTSGPITSVTFTSSTGEMDVIGSYSTANAIAAPEIESGLAASSLTLILGGVAVLKGRRQT